MLTTVLIIILILILLGAFPAWPHSRGWGYGPSGIVGLDPGDPADPASARQNLTADRQALAEGCSRKCARRSKNSACETIAFTVSG